MRTLPHLYIPKLLLSQSGPAPRHLSIINNVKTAKVREVSQIHIDLPYPPGRVRTDKPVRTRPFVSLSEGLYEARSININKHQ